ncbi:MAG: hypothetical protein IT223_04670 [Crocinitomicaceae bacterium]|nr:hypothetical protein [Crocinitomicaceae bacterium]
MKTLRLLFVTAGLLAGVDLFSQNIITSAEVKVTINGQTDRMQLADLRRDLLVVGVDFQYQPEFDQNRNLTSIHYIVKRSSDGAVLGEAKAENLVNPSVKSVFHLVKTGEILSAQCVGNCPH